METLILKTTFFRRHGSKFLVGLLIASTLSLLPVSTVLADPDGWGGHEGGWGGHEGGWRGHDRNDWDRRRAYGNGYGGYPQPVYPQVYGYAQPVYVPPPVQYIPQPSPGINLVIPLNFR